MSLPLIYFLYSFYLLLAIWALFSLAAVYHMFKFGLKNFTTFFMTFLYIAVSFVILQASYNYLSQTDWSAELPVLPGVLKGNNYVKIQ